MRVCLFYFGLNFDKFKIEVELEGLNVFKMDNVNKFVIGYFFVFVIIIFVLSLWNFFYKFFIFKFIWVLISLLYNGLDVIVWE